MAAPNKEQFKNDASSPLNGGINDSTTSIVVDTGSVFPSSGNFRVIIDMEIMICTARSTNTLTVQRGKEGTSAASHSDDAKVTHIVTQASLLQLLRDNLPFADSTHPIMNSLTDIGGATLTGSSFTWVNQGGASFTDQNGCIYLEAPAAAGENIRLLKKAAPSTPYSIIAAFVPNFTINGATGQPSGGVCFRESSTGKIYSLVMEIINDKQPHYACHKYTDHDTLTVTVKSHEWVAPLLPYWLKIRDDGTNTVFFISHNGINFIQVRSESRTAFMLGGADEVGFYINLFGQNDISNGLELVHWHEEA